MSAPLRPFCQSHIEDRLAIGKVEIQGFPKKRRPCGKSLIVDIYYIFHFTLLSSLSNEYTEAWLDK